MARITYGESITEYTGSIGGITFLRNAYGTIAKLRSNPPVNPSPRQSPYQTYLAKLVAYWPTLSQANKDAWNALAAAHKHTTPWGYIKTLSGYQWFLSVNIYRRKYDNYIFSVPAPWETLTPPDQFTLQADTTYLSCNWDPPYVDINPVMIYLTLPLRQSSIKLRRSLFYVGYFHSINGLTYYYLQTKFEHLTGVTWPAFFASSNCSIICRLQAISFGSCYPSPFTSAIIKI